MLVLSRKAGETISIGVGTEVTVLAVEGRRVRLGIHAPASVCVLRTELIEPARGRPGRRGGPAEEPGEARRRSAPAARIGRLAVRG
jgi:carbon storage regulator